ncbi:MAG: hypothetical protein J6Y79_02245 [Paludibacteraceae bacterium]|nr:hypothetical protein [Paludibacteraceae bacterium]
MQKRRIRDYRDTNRLTPLINPSLGAFFFPVMLCLGFWTIGFFAAPDETWNCEMSTPFDGLLADWMNPDSLLSHAVGALATLFTAAAMVHINELRSFIPTRTLMPFFLYVVLMGVNVNVHAFTLSQVSNLFLVSAIGVMMGSYRHLQPVGDAFRVGVLLGCAGIFCAEYLYLIFVMWICMVRLNTLTMRTFLATLLGLFLPAVLFTFLVYFFFGVDRMIDLFWGYVDLVYVPFPEFEDTLIIWLFYGVLLLMSVFSMFSSSRSSVHDNVRPHKLIGTLAWFFAGSVLFFILFTNKMPAMYALLTIFSSLLMGNYFTMKKGKLTNVLFFLLMACSLLYFLDAVIFQ